MKPILGASAMKQLEQSVIGGDSRTSRLFMEKAAAAVFENLTADGAFDLSLTVVICGSGGNGGDGILTAILLHNAGYLVEICVPSGLTMSDETRDLLHEASDAGIECRNSFKHDSATCVVDALFGIGLSRDVSDEIAAIIGEINDWRRGGRKCIACDIPSGIDGENGQICGAAVKADLTVTFSYIKAGLLLYPGREYAGRVVCADIGIHLPADSSAYRSAEDCDVSTLMPPRPRFSNKGNFGKALIIGGCRNMCGAPYLSALGAYRSGAGLVRIISPEENRIPLQTLLPEAVLSTYDSASPDLRMIGDALEWADAAVIGPGLGMSSAAAKITEFVFENARIPLIADADALNLSARHGITLPKNTATVITPHVLEMSRLSDIPVDAVLSDTLRVCLDFAAEHGVICVLKNAATVISDGSGAFINASGCSSLAKGGTGDVLSGIIASLICQGLDAYTAAMLGVYIHGRAGDIAAEKYGEYSPLASEIAACVSDVLRVCTGD